MHRVVIEFPDERSRDSFEFWLSCQGEQGFFAWEDISVSDDRPGSASRKFLGRKPIEKMVYPAKGSKVKTIKAKF